MGGMKDVFYKELTRVFKDRKMVFSLFILPVILTVGLYGLLGSLIAGMQDDIDQHEALVAIKDAPDSFRDLLAQNDSGFFMMDEREDDPDYFLEAAKQEILSGTLDLIIEFPEDFEEQISAYGPGKAIPQVKTWYNPSEDYSSAAYAEYVSGYLEQYRQMLLTERTNDPDGAAVFYVDADNPEQFIQDEDRAAGRLLGMLVPYMISILLFAGAMSLGIDAIAGEKERGTLAMLLLAPVNRTAIVLGKLFSLMVIAGISAATYVLGLVLAMPLLMGGIEAEEVSLTISFSAGQILEIAGILIIQVFLYVVLISLVSVFARNVKEGSTYISPVYILVIGLGMVTMYSTDKAQWFEYCIPLYNCSLALKNIFTKDLTAMQFLFTMVSNLLAGSIITAIIVKAFKSERVMFHA